MDVSAGYRTEFCAITGNMNLQRDIKPITYTANGKQYVAVVVGYGGAQAASFPQLTPEIPLPVARSSAIWVFELP